MERRPLIVILSLCLCFGFVKLFGQSIPLVKIAEASDADKLNPLTNVSATGSYVSEYLYFSLLGTEKETGAFVPLLAKELPKVSEDGNLYTYTIHPQAKFNSGKKITAEDVVFSIKLIKNPYVGNDNNRSQYKEILSATATGAQTVEVRLAHPSLQGLRASGDFPVFSEEVMDPEEVMRGFTFPQLNDRKQLDRDQLAILSTLGKQVNSFGNSFQSYTSEAVSGPYLLESWKRKELITLVANKKFWGRKLDNAPNAFFKQNVDRIEIHILDEEPEWRSAVFSKGFDLLASMPPGLFSELSNIPTLAQKYDFQSQPGPSYEYIGMNLKGKERGRKALFREREVRRAIAHLVEVDLLLERTHFGLGERMAAEYPTYYPDFKNGDLDLVNFDPQKAVSLLKSAGWVDSDDNGLCDKVVGGEEVQFVAEIIYNENAPQRKVIADNLFKNGRQAGMLLTVTGLPWEDYLARLRKGDYDLAIGAWVSDPNEDSYRQIWHSSNWGDGSNFGGFEDPEIDGLIDAYDRSLEMSERKVLARIIQARIYDAQPYVFLWSRDQNLVLKKGLKAKVYPMRPGFWIGDWE